MTEIGPRLVHVTGISSETSQDTLELYFESVRRSGGGTITHLIHYETNQEAILVFESSEVAENVKSKTDLSLDGSQLTAQAVNTKMELAMKMISVANVTVQDCDTAEILIENACGTEIKGISFDSEEKMAAVTLKNFEDALLLLQKGNIQYKSYKMYVKPIDLQLLKNMQRIIISGIDPGTSQDTVELFFESEKHSGGGTIECWKLYQQEGIADITFTNMIVDRVVGMLNSGSLILNGKLLHAEPYNRRKHEAMLKGLENIKSNHRIKMPFHEANYQHTLPAYNVLNTTKGNNQTDLSISTEVVVSMKEVDTVKSHSIPQSVSNVNIANEAEVKNLPLKCVRSKEFVPHASRQQYRPKNENLQIDFHLSESAKIKYRFITGQKQDIVQLGQQNDFYIHWKNSGEEKLVVCAVKGVNFNGLPQWRKKVTDVLVEMICSIVQLKVTALSDKIYHETIKRFRQIVLPDAYMECHEKELVVNIVCWNRISHGLFSKIAEAQRSISQNFNSSGLQSVNKTPKVPLVTQSKERNQVVRILNLKVEQLELFNATQWVKHIQASEFDVKITITQDNVMRIEGSIENATSAEFFIKAEFVDKIQHRICSFPRAYLILVKSLLFIEVCQKFSKMVLVRMKKESREIEIYGLAIDVIESALNEIKAIITETTLALDDSQVNEFRKGTDILTKLEKKHAEKLCLFPNLDKKELTVVCMSLNKLAIMQSVEKEILMAKTVFMHLDNNFESVLRANYLNINQLAKQYSDEMTDKITLKLENENGQFGVMISTCHIDPNTIKARIKGHMDDFIQEQKLIQSIVSEGGKVNEINKSYKSKNSSGSCRVSDQNVSHPEGKVKLPTQSYLFPAQAPASIPSEAFEEHDAMAEVNPSEQFLGEFKKTLINNCHVSVVCQYVENLQQVDCVIVGATPTLGLENGESRMFTRTVYRKAGPAVEHERQTAASQQQLSFGDVHVTSGGASQWQYIIHAICPKKLVGVQNAQKDHLDELRKVIVRSLIEADKLKVQSVILPMLGLNYFNYDCKDVLTALRHALRGFLSKYRNSLKQVILVDMHEKTARDLVTHVLDQTEKYFLQPGSKTGTVIRPVVPPRPMNTPALASMTTAEGIRLQIETGSIASYQTEVIVNSAQKDLNLSVGNISSSILKVAGTGILNECSARHPNGVVEGTVVITSGGQMPGVKNILHVVAQKYYGQQSEQILQKMIEQCLAKTSSSKLSTISIPPLGTGYLGYPNDVVIRIMCDTLTQFSSQNPQSSLKKVCIVIHPSSPLTIQSFTSFVGKYNPNVSVQPRPPKNVPAVPPLVAPSTNVKPGNKEDLPSRWTQMSGDFKMVLLKTTDDEYGWVEKQFKKTCSNNIVQIERIQSKDLFKPYKLHFEKLKKRNPQNPQNERHLFHATDKTIIDKIIHTGFNRGYAGTSTGCWYGNGVYFASEAIISNKFAKVDSKGNKYMFRCRVLTGEFTIGVKGMNVPPTKPNSKFEYDSVVNNVQNPTEFVLFHDDSAYPEYLITYN